MFSKDEHQGLTEFASYTLMNVIGMIGLSCYILADTFFIARGMGANGLAALNLAIPVYSLIHGSGLMAGIGGATRYSVFRAQEAFKSAEKVFTNAVYMAAAFSAVFVLAGLFFSGGITSLLGADSEIYEMTRIYIKVIMLFAPAFIMNDILVCFVRNDGNPGLAMTAMLVGSFSNIIMDYIFVFPLGMGIFGAVLATGFSPVIGMCILSRHWIKKMNNFHLKRTKASFRMIASILQLGFPSLFTEVASGIVIIVFNMVILHLRGNVGVAAYGVIANLSIVVTSVYTGIAQGMQPLTSRACGHGDYGQIRQIFKYALVTMAVLSIGIYIFIVGLASPIVGVFNSEHNMQLQQMAEYGLRLYFIAVPFMGFNIILSMLFTSIEKAAAAQSISIARGLVVIIPVTLLLSVILGMTGVWMALPVAEGLVAILGCILYVKMR